MSSACGTLTHVRPSPVSSIRLSLWSLRDQPRLHADALDLSFEQSLKLIAEPATENSWNLMLELPALTTRMVSVTASGPDRLLGYLTVAKEHSDGARGHARPQIVGARGENDRDARAEHDARRIGL